MRLFIFLVTVALSRAEVINHCSGVTVRGINNEKELIKAGIDNPYQLAVDYNTNTLFFSYIDPDDDNVGKSAYIDLKTNEFNTIPGIKGGFANAVDSKHHVVYLGGVDGIYTFDYSSKNATLVGANGTNIWQLFHKNKLYFKDFLSNTAYTLEEGESKKVPELEGKEILFMAIDKHENIFYTNSTGLYCLRKGKPNEDNLGYYKVNGFTTDKNENNLYFSTDDGMYEINDSGESVTKLADVKPVLGLAIDKDNNIIYSDENNIYRLRSDRIKCA